MKQRCTATTRRGLPCRAWAVRGSDPPRCRAHARRVAGAAARDRRLDPVSDANPEPSGSPAMPAADGEGALLRRRFDAVIEDLQRRHWELSHYIDEHKDEMRSGQLITAIDYQGRLANRIGRLLRDRQLLQGEADELDEAITDALAIVGDAWNVALNEPK